MKKAPMTTPPPQMFAARKTGSNPCPPKRAMNSVKPPSTEKQISPWMMSNAQRIRPPRRRAAMELPMTAFDVPRNMDVTFTAFPARRSATGVADETMSTLNTVMELLKEISRKQRPASAGLMKFLPRPPKQHLTTRMAKMDPMTGP